MSTEFAFSFEVRGEEGPIPLVVNLPTDLPARVRDSMIQVEFTVVNHLARQITFPNISVTKDGPQKDKLTVSLLSNAMTVPANGQAGGVINIEPNSTFEDGDMASVRVQATEA